MVGWMDGWINTEVRFQQFFRLSASKRNTGKLLFHIYKGHCPLGFLLGCLTLNSSSGAKGTKDFILNPCLRTMSHISGFKGMQGPDLLSSTPWHHLPPLDKVLPSPFLAWILLQCAEIWEEDGPGRFSALLISHGVWYLLVPLENVFPHGDGLQQSLCGLPHAPPCSPGMVQQTSSVS